MIVYQVVHVMPVNRKTVKSTNVDAEFIVKILNRVAGGGGLGFGFEQKSYSEGTAVRFNEALNGVAQSLDTVQHLLLGLGDIGLAAHRHNGVITLVSLDFRLQHRLVAIQINRRGKLGTRRTQKIQGLGDFQCFHASQQSADCFHRLPHTLELQKLRTASALGDGIF